MRDSFIDIAVIGDDAEELRELLYDWLPIIKAAQAYEEAQTAANSGAVCKAVRALDKAEEEK